MSAASVFMIAIWTTNHNFLEPMYTWMWLSAKCLCLHCLCLCSTLMHKSNNLRQSAFNNASESVNQPIQFPIHPTILGLSHSCHILSPNAQSDSCQASNKLILAIFSAYIVLHPPKLSIVWAFSDETECAAICVFSPKLGGKGSHTSWQNKVLGCLCFWLSRRQKGALAFKVPYDCTVQFKQSQSVQ